MIMARILYCTRAALEGRVSATASMTFKNEAECLGYSREQFDECLKTHMFRCGVLLDVRLGRSPSSYASHDGAIGYFVVFYLVIKNMKRTI